MTHALKPASTPTLRINPIVTFAAVTVLWLAYGAMLVAAPDTLGDLWRAVGDLWLPLKAVIWVLFLPWMIGLWVWQSSWPLAVRLTLDICLGVTTVIAFFPRRGTSASRQERTSHAAHRGSDPDRATGGGGV
jgi:hypothetical protein